MAQTTEEILNKLKTDILEKSETGTEYSRMWIRDIFKIIDSYLPQEEPIVREEDGVIHIEGPIN